MRRRLSLRRPGSTPPSDSAFVLRTVCAGRPSWQQPGLPAAWVPGLRNELRLDANCVPTGVHTSLPCFPASHFRPFVPVLVQVGQPPEAFDRLDPDLLEGGKYGSGGHATQLRAHRTLLHAVLFRTRLIPKTEGPEKGLVILRAKRFRPNQLDAFLSGYSFLNVSTCSTASSNRRNAFNWRTSS